MARTAGFGAKDASGNFYFKALGDGEIVLGNSDDDQIQITGSVGINNNVFFLTNGRLGIGTDAPDYKLDVAGNIGINEHVYHNGDGDTRVSFPAANQINLVAGGKSVFKFASNTITLNNGNNDIDTKIMADNGQEVVFVNAGNNRVGIGTTSPSVDLDVAGDVNFDGSAVFNESGAQTKDLRVESFNNTHMFFIDASSNRIGIGNNSPQTVLDIQDPLDGTGAEVDAVIRLRSKRDVGIKLIADTANTSGEADNPFIDFYQDSQTDTGVSRNSRLATLAMEGNANTSFTGSLQNGFFLDAFCPNAQPSSLRTIQLANDSTNNGHKARITLEGTNGFVGIHTNTPGSPLEVSGNVRLHGTTTSQFYVTEVKEQDLGTGTNSSLAVASGTILLDADSINGFDMGGGMEVHDLAFPRGNDSGTRLSLIVKTTTNSVFILPSGLISGTFDSLNNDAGVTATEYVWISEGTHQAWHQVK